MSPNKKNQKSIESRLAELETILEELESGDLELDQALKKFEQGVKLSRECQKTLEDAEIKIKILMDNELKDTDQSLEH
ncbi:MAG TPA: exodeoxyribonuclease VII small subunit [Gammaproteobacteria bacterium]|jgi:exodeoxyribonuclease VII small subunit|nr:exodeoxyribonuclease VII small subunit [Gammaproteobacteria bacterium]HIK76606.1 exodeoxyribonuclease VII small subunit [Gammaproteobacteria bacterium]|tara:strand:+ start:96 stop:329 length:234 start_codon:yes stop_codon:yes gene_type:complete